MTMKTSKIMSCVMAAAVILGLTGCSNGAAGGSSASTENNSSSTASTPDSSSSSATESTGTSAASDSTAGDSTTSLTGAITVVSREDGSGTRGAFVELLGIEQKNEAGEKEDMTRADAEIVNSTNGVMMSVAGNPSALGYISLGSLNDTVKAIKVDGVEVSAENIKAGNYKVARPFEICYKEDALDDLTKDFIKFITSTDGQAIVEENGYLSIDATEAYTPVKQSGTISANGSTSVGPLMEKLGAKYEELTGVKVEVQQTGSGAGITAATEGACSFGMSSRELKQEELDAGLTELKIADDGIAVIVNGENPVDDLTSEQIMKIYTGEINNWEELN